jgi:hypothetical protein
MHCDDMHCEIVEKTPAVPSVFIDHGEVRINGDLVPRDVWRMVRPRAGRPNETAITLHLQLRKRANKPAGGKNTVALVATIAVLLAAAAVSGGLLAPLAASAGFAAPGAGSLSAAVVVGSDGLGRNYVQQNVQHRETSVCPTAWYSYNNPAGWRPFTALTTN